MYIARQNVRHFQAESHFRKDQRWRYEHLKKKDKATDLVTNEVRGKNGQILTPLELEREKLYFESAPLVETGCDYPFFDDYMAGPGTFVNSNEARLCVRISQVGHFTTSCGD